MIGQDEKKKRKKCPLCGGTMNDGIASVPFLIRAKIIVIKDVPAEICSDCGEAYMKSHVVDKVEKCIDSLECLHSEIAIINFKAA